MPYQIQIAEKPTYLHAVVTGRNSIENVTGHLKDLLRECKTWDVYQIASDNSTLAEAETWLAARPR